MLTQKKSLCSVLVFVWKDMQLLMIEKKIPGIQKPLWNALGGKSEGVESPLETAVREVQEEAHLELDPLQLKFMGIATFPEFSTKVESGQKVIQDWIVFVWVTHLNELPPHWHPPETREGKTAWVPKDEILNLHLWPGDLQFFPAIIKEQPFIATLWYTPSQIPGELAQCSKIWIQEISNLKHLGS